ncbi:hypothetical protein BST20_05320 [Mycobacterium branderi]|uniref:Lipoprotein LppJ n=2 Tax=Mycobacterium branderi TaxID=43348 RepID=A0AA91RK69_9MYCO|nr:hypothetical protein [Mycobacterium branderi]ORA41510.1 hypothetical protein BST20_05320 [Mycobacterium branderi]
MTTNRISHLRRRCALLVGLTLVLVLGGCSLMFPSRHRASPDVAPLSDEQSRAQVVDPAKEIVKATGLHVAYATFAWEWCNDQGEPPYHGRVDMTFDIPEGTDRNAFFRQISATMAKQPGWGTGAAPGMRPHGENLHKDNITITMGPAPNNGGSIQLLGECRNMNDHRNDSGWHDITDEIAGG